MYLLLWSDDQPLDVGARHECLAARSGAVLQTFKQLGLVLMQSRRAREEVEKHAMV